MIEKLANYEANGVCYCPACGDNRPTVFVYSHTYDDLVCVKCKVHSGERVWGRHRRETAPVR